jgi:hypothetical protein
VTLLTRLLLMAVALALAFSAAAFFAATWPWSALAVLLGVVGRAMRPRPGKLSAHGTAEWADAAYLRDRGMLGPGPGLVVGRHWEESP